MKTAKAVGSRVGTIFWRDLMTEPLLSVVGGGLAAAVVTIGFNVWWDKKKLISTMRR